MSAVGCLAACAIALCVALYFQFIATSQPTQIVVPPLYVAPAPAIDLHTVDSHLPPPANIRIVITKRIIDGPLQDGEILGRFEADTANKLADFPDDFEIVGGRDAKLFDRGPPREGGHATLIPTAELRRQVDGRLSDLKAEVRQSYALEVVARDNHGLYSATTDVTFSILFGPVPSPSAPPSAPTYEMSSLERLARDIAQIAGQEGTPANRIEHDTALQEPLKCGSSPTNVAFITSYRQAFDSLRGKLTPANLAGFYDGVCDAWQRALYQQEQARLASEGLRNAAIARNREAVVESEFRSIAALTSRNATLTVVAAALGAFLIVSCLLAFLAIENHSRVTREAVARLTESKEHHPQSG